MGEDQKDREEAVSQREAEVGRREEALADRLEGADRIVLAADERDAAADRRDDRSVFRERAADVKAFVDLNINEYGHDNAGRRRAAEDRSHAKEDRSSSAADRGRLTEQITEPDESTES